MYQHRLRIIYIALCAGLLILAAKLVWLQVWQITDVDPSYRLTPRRSWQIIPAPRGTITDRNGNILAEDQPVLDLAVAYKNLCIQPPESETPLPAKLEWLPEACAIAGKNLAEIEQTRSNILARVDRIRKSVLRRAKASRRRILKIREETIPHTLIHNIPLELAARIEANPDHFPGAVIRPSLKRVYPNHTLAVHALGYTVTARYTDPVHPEPIRGDPTIEPGDRIGQLGAERAFDSLLRGVPGYCDTRRDKKTGRIKRNLIFPARPGKTIILTLHLAAQKRAENALAGKAGGVVVMDCRNGEILVLASAPTYDNNDLASAWQRAQEEPRSGLFLSRAMRGAMPSGSAIKPIIALAAAQAGAVTPQTTFFCDGAMHFGNRNWTCYGRHGHINMAGAIEHSCNIWFYNAALKAKPQALAALAAQLGWGKKTGIDLPSESPGFLPTPATGWYPGNTLNLSIGQGNLRVTPLQAAVAIAAIANRGNILSPHILLRTDTGNTSAEKSFIIRQVNLPSAALEAVRKGMRRVPISGTANARPFGPRLAALRIAAKTGTAQTGNRRINHAWLVGYLPHDNPRYAFAVVIHNTPGHGAEIAGPIAADTLEGLMNSDF